MRLPHLSFVELHSITAPPASHAKVPACDRTPLRTMFLRFHSLVYNFQLLFQFLTIVPLLHRLFFFVERCCSSSAPSRLYIFPAHPPFHCLGIGHSWHQSVISCFSFGTMRLDMLDFWKYQHRYLHLGDRVPGEGCCRKQLSAERSRF